VCYILNKSIFTDETVFFQKRITKYKLFLFAILFFGYLIRVCIALNTTISRDGITYMNYAQQYDQIERYHDTILYPYILSLLSKFYSNQIIVCLAFNIVLGTVFLFLVYLFILSIFKNETVALIVTYISAINPSMVRFSTDILRENLFLCLSFLSVLLLPSRCFSKNFWCYTALSSFFAALSLLTKFEALFLIIYFILIVIFFQCRLSRKILIVSYYLILLFSVYTILLFSLKPVCAIEIFNRAFSQIRVLSIG